MRGSGRYLNNDGNDDDDDADGVGDDKADTHDNRTVASQQKYKATTPENAATWSKDSSANLTPNIHPQAQSQTPRGSDPNCL